MSVTYAADATEVRHGFIFPVTLPDAQSGLMAITVPDIKSPLPIYWPISSRRASLFPAGGSRERPLAGARRVAFLGEWAWKIKAGRPDVQLRGH
jgi:hypothetical protein